MTLGVRSAGNRSGDDSEEDVREDKIIQVDWEKLKLEAEI